MRVLVAAVLVLLLSTSAHAQSTVHIDNAQWQDMDDWLTPYNSVPASEYDVGVGQWAFEIYHALRGSSYRNEGSLDGLSIKEMLLRGRGMSQMHGVSSDPYDRWNASSVGSGLWRMLYGTLPAYNVYQGDADPNTAGFGFFDSMRDIRDDLQHIRDAMGASDVIPGAGPPRPTRAYMEEQLSAPTEAEFSERFGTVLAPKRALFNAFGDVPSSSETAPVWHFEIPTFTVAGVESGGWSMNIDFASITPIRDVVRPLLIVLSTLSAMLIPWHELRRQ